MNKMTEIKRIERLFANLYDGNNWIDVTILSTLSGITAKQAAERIFPNSNTIWEITNHITSWRKSVLKRVSGQVVNAPGNNYFEPVRDTSETAWKKTLGRLESTQKEWLTFLKDFREADFEKIYQPRNLTYYEHIQGIIQHDAYHLGQIVLLSKQVKT